jgi:hypothetical protein
MRYAYWHTVLFTSTSRYHPVRTIWGVGVVGVTLVDLYRQGGPGVTRIQTHHRQREGAQLVHQPGRQRAALQPDPLER